MRKILTLVAFLSFSGFLVAQQDAMFTKYMFNTLSYNPGYAGAKDHMSVGLLHRTQWWGIDGAPSTQSFNVHTPLKNERVGVGINVMNDNIGPTNNFGANLSYAYRIPLGSDGAKLSIGVQAGAENYRTDWTKLNLNPEQGPDPSYGENVNMWLPNFGAGVYYYSKYFYAGVSVPHLVEYSLRDEDVTTELYARQYRHYYAALGAAIPINGDDLIFKPSILVKNVGLDSKLRKDEPLQNVSAPTSLDIDLSVLFYETFWVGLSYRTAVENFSGTSSGDSVDLWVSYLLKNGFRIGAAYDYTLTKLQGPAVGSFEIMLGYEFDYETKKTVTPRYF